MTFLLAVGLGPALLMVLATGLGLGVDRLAGSRLKGALIPPVGFAALVVFGQFSIRVWAPATPWVALVLAVAGAVYGRRRAIALATRAAAIPAAATALAYLLAVSPVLLSGRTTMPTFLLDSSTGNHISGSHALLEHGPSMASEPQTSDGIYLQSYFGSGYPSGGHVSFGILDALVPGSGLWLWAPFLACLLALIAPSVWATLRALDIGRGVAALGAVAASVPMITLAYAWMGAIKEVSAVPSLALMAALIAAPSGVVAAGSEGEEDGGLRTVLPLGLACGAFVACVGVAGAAWVGAAGVAFVVVRFADVRARPAFEASAKAVVGLAVATAVLCLPTLLDFSKQFSAAKSFSQGNAVAVADPGNLLQPLHAVQVLGTWIAEDHRLDPTTHLAATYQFIGISLVLVGFGALHLIRTRRWAYLVWLVAISGIWWALTRRGTIWTDAKLIVLTAPLAVTVVYLGVAGAVTRRSHVARGALAVVVAAGVVWSLAVEYHATNLLPTARYQELIDIGDRIKQDDGIAYVTDFDEYVFAALPGVHTVSAGFSYKPEWAAYLQSGGFAGYGTSVDIDEVSASTLDRTPWIIQRNRPLASRPPSNFRLVTRGHYYSLWQRTGDAPISHIAASGPPSAPSASGPVLCRVLQSMAGRASALGAQLEVATRPQTLPIPLSKKAMITSPGWPYQDGGGFLLDGPGRMQTHITVPAAGRWRLWFIGDVGREARVTVDGRAVGSFGMQSGGQGNAIGPITASLTKGRHRLSVFRGGGSLRPGDGQVTALRGAYLERDVPSTMNAVSPAVWRSLCGRQLDWVEIVRK